MPSKLSRLLTFVTGFGFGGRWGSDETHWRGSELPPYRVERHLPDEVELRRYDASLVAQVTTTGARQPALTEGFRRLAAFIFGENRAGDEIAMTAPVGQSQTQTQSQEIAMTAPVGQSGGQGEWVTTFTMPSKWTLATLPKPVDPGIRIRELPPWRAAVIVFPGKADDALLKEKTEELMAAVRAEGLTVEGGPEFAFYDDPTTLPALRRNEVLVRLA